MVPAHSAICRRMCRQPLLVAYPLQRRQLALLVLEAQDASIEALERFTEREAPIRSDNAIESQLTLGVVKKLQGVAVILDQRLSELEGDE